MAQCLIQQNSHRGLVNKRSHFCVWLGGIKEIQNPNGLNILFRAFTIQI